VMARQKIVGKVLRCVMYPLENTGLRIFGLSHFVVLVSEPPGVEKARQAA